MVRARAVLELAQVLDRELEERGGTALLRRGRAAAGARARRDGAGGHRRRHRPARARSRPHFAAAVAEAAENSYREIGQEINLGSPKQLQTVLFDAARHARRPSARRPGYTTDAEALADLYTKTEHPFLLHLLRHRDASRLRQTVEGLIKSVADDGRIHTTYQQTIAATAGCRAPTRTCRTSRSAPRRAARSARRSWSGPATRAC